MKLYPLLSVFSFLSASALAAPYQGVLKGELNASRPQDYTNASVTLDADAKTLDLLVQPKATPCPPGRVCTAMMPIPLPFNFEAVKISVNNCGIIRTVGINDQRPVDGPLVNFELIDNTQNRCPTVAVLPPTQLNLVEVSTNMLTGKQTRRANQFQGPALKAEQAPEAPEFQGQIQKVYYQPKQLELTLQHSGGCKEHAFDLKWGDCKSTEVLNTTLKECKVTLLHSKGSDDYCEALITKKYSIDLSHLGAAYILNLNGKRVLVH